MQAADFKTMTPDYFDYRLYLEWRDCLHEMDIQPCVEELVRRTPQKYHDLSMRIARTAASRLVNETRGGLHQSEAYDHRYDTPDFLRLLGLTVQGLHGITKDGIALKRFGDVPTAARAMASYFHHELADVIDYQTCRQSERLLGEGATHESRQYILQVGDFVTKNHDLLEENWQPEEGWDYPDLLFPSLQDGTGVPADLIEHNAAATYLDDFNAGNVMYTVANEVAGQGGPAFLKKIAVAEQDWRKQAQGRKHQQVR